MSNLFCSFIDRFNLWRGNPGFDKHTQRERERETDAHQTGHFGPASSVLNQNLDIDKLVTASERFTSPPDEDTINRHQTPLIRTQSTTVIMGQDTNKHHVCVCVCVCARPRVCVRRQHHITSVHLYSYSQCLLYTAVIRSGHH